MSFRSHPKIPTNIYVHYDKHDDVYVLRTTTLRHIYVYIYISAVCSCEQQHTMASRRHTEIICVPLTYSLMHNSNSSQVCAYYLIHSEKTSNWMGLFF